MMKKTTPELHDVTKLPAPDVQIIEEKSSSSTLVSSMGVSYASINNSTSHDCITELEHIIATQETDAKKAKDEFKKNLMLTIIFQKQEMIQLKNKQQEKIEGLNNDHQMNLVATNKRQIYMEAMLSHQLRKSMESS